MSSVVSVMFAIVVGLVMAAASANLYAALTSRRLRFERGPEDGVWQVARFALLVVGGPLVIMRNSWLATARQMRPAYWLILSSVVAAAWSFCLGLAALNLFIAAG